MKWESIKKHFFRWGGILTFIFIGMGMSYPLFQFCVLITVLYIYYGMKELAGKINELEKK